MTVTLTQATQVKIILNLKQICTQHNQWATNNLVFILFLICLLLKTSKLSLFQC